MKLLLDTHLLLWGALGVSGLPPIHRDPFDRIVIAQASLEGITLLTADSTISRYPAPIRMV